MTTDFQDGHHEFPLNAIIYFENDNSQSNKTIR